MYQTRDHRQAAMQALQGAANTTGRMMRERPEQKTNAADVVQGAMGSYAIYEEGKDLIGSPETAVEGSETITSQNLASADMVPVSQTGEPVMAPGAAPIDGGPAIEGMTTVSATGEPVMAAEALEGSAMVEGAAPVVEAAIPAAGGAVETAVAGTTAVTEGVAAGTALAEGAAVAEGAAAATAAAETAVATGSMAGPVGVGVAVGAVAIGSLLF